MARRYYYQDIRSPITGQRVRITASDRAILATKIQRQYERWQREQERSAKVELKQQADERTQAVRDDILSVQNILKATLVKDDKIDWRSLLDERQFPDSEPSRVSFSRNTVAKSLSFFGSFKKRALEQEAAEERKYKGAVAAYKTKKEEWEKAQLEHNELVVKQKDAYEDGFEEGVEQYISMVFDRSEYPDTIIVNGEVIYSQATRTLLVELMLPPEQTVPSVSQYRFVSSRNVIEPKPMREKDFMALYDDVQYQIVLRTIHEVFEADYKLHIQSVVVNGNAEVSDRATGKTSVKPILTIQVQREEFLSVNLSNVDPGSCFRHFKGVTSGSLVQLIPVKPLLKLNRQDKRVIEVGNVLDAFNPAQNLATMDWEKFEVLIRDLFRKEFSGEGMTVEVTRASRDSGVDGIAFDEDPIRGGKFVIQAKRYNNLVPVSAVRDLYGTVLNEGAVKGILVTTSYYGPDAISFVKDKPLTLINGEELLYMFKKHGSDFKIELQKEKRASKVPF